MNIRADKIENILVTGKSGAGKQPRIDVLLEEFGLEQLSTGNIFREYLGIFKKTGYNGSLDVFYNEQKNNFISDEQILEILKDSLSGQNTNDVLLGLKAIYFVNSGKFVPDEITNKLFESYFAKSKYKGMVLDGYPRTVDQAKYLLELTGEKGTKIDLILFVDNEDDAIIKRTVGRRICPNCKKVYHVEFKPAKDGKYCTKCGAEVILRADDTEEKIRTRLNEFTEKCIPALDYLKSKGIPVYHVPGNLPVFTPEAVKESVLKALTDVK